MARTAALRASDADREAVAERLRQATVEGRLEPYELEERLHAALRARTYEDLRRLVADLPGPSGTQAPFARTAFDAARMGTQVPFARTAFGVALRVAVVLAVVAGVIVVAATIAAWWILWALVWFSVRIARGSFACRPGAPRARVVRRV